MQRLSTRISLALAGALLLGTALPARALVVAIPAGPAKVTQADTILVGQVVGMLDRDVQVAEAANAGQTSLYRVAVVQVEETLKGNNKKELVRVGFPVPMQPQAQPIQGGGGRVVIRHGFNRGGQQLALGQGGLFFLKKHASGQFLELATPYGSFVSSQGNPGFQDEIKLTRQTMKILDNPLASLKSQDASERYLAAATLVMQYRTFQGSPNTAPIPAEENRLILKTLAEADWNLSSYSGPLQQMNPLVLFGRLGISQQDGYQQPRPQQGQNYQQAITQAMQSWLKKNADTYRIQKFLPGKGNEVGQPGRPVQIQPLPGVQIQPLPVRPGQAVPQIRGAVPLPAQPAIAPVEIEVQPKAPQR